MISLDEPPVVVNAGVSVHGVTSLRDVFLLPDLWQLHLYDYRGSLTVDGQTYELRPGRVSLVPPGAEVVYRYEGRSEHLYAHLRAEGSGLVVQDAPHLADSMRNAIVALPRAPKHAAAEVWAVLWRISALAAAPGPHPAVAQAFAYIESHLATPLTVPEIARHSGISHNHLIRLFRAETGDTVVAYLRRRRLIRAEHLLRESTLPIPAVAAAVGIPDLQAFNKACRRELGESPRALRQRMPRR